MGRSGTWVPGGACTSGDISSHGQLLGAVNCFFWIFGWQPAGSLLAKSRNIWIICAVCITTALPTCSFSMRIWSQTYGRRIVRHCGQGICQIRVPPRGSADGQSVRGKGGLAKVATAVGVEMQSVRSHGPRTRGSEGARSSVPPFHVGPQQKRSIQQRALHGPRAITLTNRPVKEDSDSKHSVLSDSVLCNKVSGNVSRLNVHAM